jgi:hypothetical protein
MMTKIINRIKKFWRLWKLSAHNDVFVVKDEAALEALRAVTLEIKGDEILAIPNEGDGEAEFFGDATHDEFIEYERDQRGIKKWYDRIKNL